MSYIKSISSLSASDASELSRIDIVAKSALSAKDVTTVQKAANAKTTPTATSAASVTSINSNKKITTNINISAQDLVGSALSANTNWGMLLSAVPWAAVSSTNKDLGARNNATTANWKSVASSNSGFVVPKDAKDYIDKTVTGISAGIYQVRGSSTVANLTATDKHVVGYVYNVSTSGTIPSGQAYNGSAFEVQIGDNVVWLGGKTGETAGWDKLGNSMAAAESTLKKYADASADMGHFDSTYSTVTNTTNLNKWDNSKQLSFANVTVNNGSNTNMTIKAGSITGTSTTLTLNGSDNVGVTGDNTNKKITIGMKAWSGYSTVYANTTEGTSLAKVATASALGATIGFGLQTSPNITYTTTSDENGHPLIKINKTDNNTTYSKATSAKLGMVQRTYFQPNSDSSKPGVLMIQGTMNSTTFNSGGNV